MFRIIVTIFFLSFNFLQTKSSVVPFKYTLVAPQNIRPFAAQVSTFSRNLNVLDAPLAAGVLNPPAIFPKAVAFPDPLIAPPALLPAPVAAPAVLPPPIAPHGFFPAPVAAPGVLPVPIEGPAVLPVPVGAPFAAVPEPHLHGHFHAPPVGVYPGPPAHVLPVPNARSVHAVASAVEPVLW